MGGSGWPELPPPQGAELGSEWPELPPLPSSLHTPVFLGSPAGAALAWLGSTLAGNSMYLVCLPPRISPRGTSKLRQRFQTAG